MSGPTVLSHSAWKADPFQAGKVAQKVDELRMLVMRLEALGYAPNSPPTAYESLLLLIEEVATEAAHAASWCSERGG